METPGKPIIATGWVKAPMQALYKKRTTTEQVGTKTVTKTKGIFKKTSFETEKPIYEQKEQWIPTGKYSDIEVDIEQLADNINQVCEQLIESGYRIMQIIPVNSGRYSYKCNEGAHGGYGYGFGYGVTDGVVVVGELRDLG